MTEHESVEAAEEAAANVAAVATTPTTDDDAAQVPPLSSLEPVPPPQPKEGDRRLTRIAVRAGAIVDGISIGYSNGMETRVGGDGGTESVLELNNNNDEIVNLVQLRYNPASFVQCLTFHTNQGRQLGPCGGTGGLFVGGFDGQEVVVKAPRGAGLVGVYGREGKYLDAIGFYWGHFASTAAAENNANSAMFVGAHQGMDDDNDENNHDQLTIEKTECFGGDGGGPFDDRESCWLATRSLEM